MLEAQVPRVNSPELSAAIDRGDLILATGTTYHLFITGNGRPQDEEKYETDVNQLL